MDEVVADPRTETPTAARALHARLRRQEALVELGQLALRAVPFDELARRAAELVVVGLPADRAAVFELAGGDELVPRAGAGWSDGALDGVELSLTRLLGAPATEGVTESVTVVVRTPDGPLGALGAYARAPRVFASDEVGFLEGVAHVLAGAALRLRADATLRQGAERFEALIRSAPDAVLLVDARGTIREVNDQAERLFGYTADELVGRSVELLVPDSLAAAHVRHREGFVDQPRARLMGSGLDLSARRKDGIEVPVEVSLGAIETDDGLTVAAFVRDATERRRAEGYALRLHDGEVRRRHALEINDSVVQGLATAIYALDAGRPDAGGEAIRRTLASARLLMDNLLAGSAAEGPLAPGDLVRADAVAPLAPAAPPPGPRRASPDAIRVLLADDAEDIRVLLRLAIERRPGIEVVAEAGDGAEAVALAERHRPDVVVLDLAMPVMDGLEAIPEIRARTPGARIVVLSGFDAGRMRGTTLGAGADAYLEKGEAIANLLDLVVGLCPDKPLPAAIPSPPAAIPSRPAGDDALGADPTMLTHELRTPLTVIRGIVATLLAGHGDLPSATVRELLDAISRNERHMEALIDAVADAHRLGTHELALVPEPTDLGHAVHATLADLGPITAGRVVQVDAPVGIVAQVDPLRLRQVLTNLVSNAARYSTAGAPIAVDLRRRDTVAELRVTDQGPGIPSAVRERLFDRYVHAGGPGHGMGLGLYLSRGIARAHGGDLDLTPDAGPGATFVLTLPLA